MIEKLKKYQRLEISLLLMSMTLFCFTLSLLRYYISGTKVFFFLNWNLFLAWIPFIMSSLLVIFHIKSKISLVIVVTVWVLFFPNSPYILTDLFHLKSRDTVPVWYDLIVILSYAWVGLICGFMSLNDIKKLLTSHFKKRIINIGIVFFLFLSGFGVYLGRFLRWNSWDILNNPLKLINDIATRLIFPVDHPRTWGMTILMGLLLNFMYLTFTFYGKKTND